MKTWKKLVSGLLVIAFMVGLAPMGAQAASVRYDITVKQPKNGFVTVIDTEARPGELIDISVEPNYGYQVDEVKVYVDRTDKVHVRQLTDYAYNFTMPSGDVVVDVTFEKKKAPVYPQPQPDPDYPQYQPQPDQGAVPFTDITRNAWYYGAVKYVYENNMMNGISDTLFFPNKIVTRAELTTILWKMEHPYGDNKYYPQRFVDVPQNQWYSKAVNWAASKGIIAGYGGGWFGPEDTVNREQIVSILYNYARYKGYNITRTTDISAYRDAWYVSPWAMTAIKWSIACDVLHGVGYHKLMPKSGCTRAELATMLMNFDLGVDK